MATTARTRTPVLIVGAGPAGLMTALGLARQGVASTIVERHAGTSIFPRATAVSLRSMEILRGHGLEDAVRAFSTSVRPTMAMAPALAGPVLAEVPLGFPSDDDAGPASPTRPAVSPQDHLEPVLVDRLRELGLTTFRFETELVGFEQGATGVTATVRDRRTGETSTIAAAYLVGADGGRSAVRRLLEIPVAGAVDLQHHASILFRADLWPVVGERRHGLYLVGAPGEGTIVLPTGPDDRWVLAAPGDAGTAARLAADPEAAIALVRRAAGIPDLAVEILSVLPLAFSAELAARWRVGRAFLVGDAAHRMPPYGGRGMNTAIADAHNLAWKLAWVLRGLADPALLDTYEAERGPVGRRNIALALARFPEQLAASGILETLPAGASVEETPDGLLEDLGYAYASDGIVSEPTDVTEAAEAAEPSAEPAGPSATDEAPRWTAAPGARAPHAWLAIGGKRVSTVDLVGDGLVVIARGSGAAWRRAVRGLGSGSRLLAYLGAVGPAMPPVPVPPVAVRSVGRGLVDADATFAAAYCLEDGGAVLVRPDGHVAARWRTAPADHRAALADALAAVLGHRSGPRAGLCPEAAPEPAGPALPSGAGLAIA